MCVVTKRNDEANGMKSLSKQIKMGYYQAASIA